MPQYDISAIATSVLAEVWLPGLVAPLSSSAARLQQDAVWTLRLGPVCKLACVLSMQAVGILTSAREVGSGWLMTVDTLPVVDAVVSSSTHASKKADLR